MDLIANAYEYLHPGGPVMIPLILISLWMWALIVERVLYFRRIDKDNVDLKQAVKMLSGAHLPETSNGLQIRVVASFIKERTGNKKLDRDILDQCAMREMSPLKRYLSVIAVLAAVASLFGLLGTVTGMMTTFNVIALFGTGNARAMAGGISEALITTQSGLLVAIPGLFMSAFLIRRANRLESRLNEVVMTLKRNV
ncbi:MAG: MotA/TolQ/ExbB proton channel family protein [Deltaproteobacteria bacterium]|jgi:biopolymer transport protein ExbB|nr:MotA/TolQ/ExbB proton channel family protein [Deltaproteobacteria bacterium]